MLLLEATLNCYSLAEQVGTNSYRTVHTLPDLPPILLVPQKSFPIWLGEKGSQKRLISLDSGYMYVR